MKLDKLKPCPCSVPDIRVGDKCQEQESPHKGEEPEKREPIEKVKEDEEAREPIEDWKHRRILNFLPTKCRERLLGIFEQESEKANKYWESIDDEPEKTLYIGKQWGIDEVCREVRMYLDETTTAELEGVEPLENGNQKDCGFCGGMLYTTNDALFLQAGRSFKYCPHCGTKINWEGR